MPATCATCGFPLDPGAPCPRCKRVPSPSRATSPAWAVTAASEGPAPVSVSPPITPPGGAIFDRVRSNPRIQVPSVPSDRPPLLARALAFLIDAAAVSLIGGAFLAAGATAYGLDDLKRAGGGNALAGARSLLQGVPGLATACAILLLAVVTGYFVWFLATEGRTPGMALLRLRVTRKDGRPLGLSGALTRWGAFCLALLPVGLGVLWTAFSEEERGAHDLLAGQVVKRG